MASFRSFVALAFAALLLVVSLLAMRPVASAAEIAPVSESLIALRTPPFVQVGKRYAFTWAGGGPAQTYTVKTRRDDGWVQVEVADENTNPAFFVPGDNPLRWLNVGTAISIQEMRPHQ